MEKDDIDEMRHVLQLVKKSPTVEYPDDRDLFGDFLNVMGIISNNCIEELAPELYDLVDHPDEFIRAEVIVTLGYSTRLGISEFQLQCYEIWLNDPSEMVKFSALSSWSTYYTNSKNKQVIAILYKIVADPTYSYQLRCTAYSSILSIIDYITLYVHDYAFAESRDNENPDFNKCVDWDKFNMLILEHAPEIFQSEISKSK